MELLRQLVQMLLHLSPQSVDHFAQFVGPTLMYCVLFTIIFCETGLVVLPFLPGDSLLFAVGAVAASSHSVSLPVLAVLLCLAANCGDLVNYLIGYRIGPRVFHFESSKLLNKKHLMEAHQFYEKHGGKTIILARFVPIVRTFAPFVAGVGRMKILRFALFSVTGGIIWVNVCLLAGYKLAKIAFVQKHFEVVVLVIIGVSVVPVAISWLRSRGKEHKVPAAQDQGDGPTPTYPQQRGFEVPIAKESRV